MRQQQAPSPQSRFAQQAPQARQAPVQPPQWGQAPTQEHTLQNVQQVPQQPPKVTVENLAEAAAFWKGGQGSQSSAMPCPRCGGPHFYTDMGTSARGVQPAPHCFNCGYNGLFEQGLAASWG